MITNPKDKFKEELIHTAVLCFEFFTNRNRKPSSVLALAFSLPMKALVLLARDSRKSSSRTTSKIAVLTESCS